MTLLMGEETCVNVKRLLLQASEGELALCALEVQVGDSFARGGAVRVLQAALRLWLRRGLWYVHGRPAQLKGPVLVQNITDRRRAKG